MADETTVEQPLAEPPTIKPPALTVESDRWAIDNATGGVEHEIVTWLLAPQDDRSVPIEAHAEIIKAEGLPEDTPNLWFAMQLSNPLFDVEAAIKESSTGKMIEHRNAEGKKIKVPEVKPQKGHALVDPFNAPLRDGLTLVDAATAAKQLEAILAAAQKEA